eukprot:6516359-Pyramimonas_sp.AAC.2
MHAYATAAAQLGRARETHEAARAQAEAESMTGKEETQEEEMQAGLALKEAADALAVAEREYRDEDELAANFERQTTIRGAQVAIRR